MRLSSVVLVLAFGLPAVAHAQPSPFAPTPDPAPAQPQTERAAGTNDGAAAAGGARAAASEPAPAMVDVYRVAVGAGGLVTFGSAPAVAVGVRGSAELATGRWSLGVEGRYDLPSSGHTTQGANVRTSLAGGSFVPCVRARALWACAVVLAAHLSAEGAEGAMPPVSDSGFFLGVGGRLVMHAALPADFALRVGGELLAHPIAIELSSGDHRLYKSSVVSISIGPTLVRAF